MDQNFLEVYAELVDRELQAVIKNLDNVSDNDLWKTKGSISNSAGVLAQHLVGNLNYYIGFVLGDTGYVRKRDLEFQPSDKTKSGLIEALENTRNMVGNVIPKIDPALLEKPYPVDNTGNVDTQTMLMRMFIHLGYHSGQLNYLSRIL